MSETTRLIDAMNGGDAGAAAALWPLVYDELRRVARKQMKNERGEHTLDATALVHEAYLRLVDVDRPASWAGRRHFFAAAAEAMRRILVDHARRRNAIKRGGAMKAVELDDELPATVRGCENVDVLALSEALDRLASHDAFRNAARSAGSRSSAS
jgi:RNA polymerase sigma factor (TIGR02999 family)